MLDWCKKIASGKETGASIVKNFVDSNEFVKKNYTNEQKLEILYETMMGRGSDTNGKKFWLDYLNSGFTTDFVINGFASSTEFGKICETYQMKPGTVSLTKYRDKNKGVTSFVARCYTEALGRAYDTNGLEYWCEMILTGKMIPSQVANGFITSTEFVNKKLNDTEFLHRLYRTFFGRDEDAVGMAYWLPQMSKGLK